MKATWSDVQLAYEHDKITSLDKDTLEAFSRVQPPDKMSEIYRTRWAHIQHQISRSIERIESTEREVREIRRHRQTFFFVLVGLAVSLLSVLIAWFAWQQPKTEPSLAPLSKVNSLSLPRPAQEPQK